MGRRGVGAAGFPSCIGSGCPVFPLNSTLNALKSSEPDDVQKPHHALAAELAPNVRYLRRGTWSDTLDLVSTASA